MIVHIVNPANRSFYANYLKMIYNLHDEDETSFIDRIDDVEYLLNLAINGELIGYCRFTPTIKPHLLNTTHKDLIQSKYEIAHNVWECSKFVYQINVNSTFRKAALAQICAASLEWALQKGIKKIIGLSDYKAYNISKKLGWQVRNLGKNLSRFKPNELSAFEYLISRTALESTRIFFGLEEPSTIMAPPQIDERTITISQISFIEAAILASSEGKNIKKTYVI